MIFTKRLILNEKELRQIITPSGFYEVWIKATKYFKTYVETYEAIEDIFVNHYGVRKYSGYDSFRKYCNRKIK